MGKNNRRLKEIAMYNGNSGAVLTIYGDIIEKESTEIPKLQFSIKKQQEFTATEKIKAPQIFETGFKANREESDYCYFAKMQFIDGNLIWEEPEWRSKITTIFEWVQRNINRSTRFVPQKSINEYSEGLREKAAAIGKEYKQIVDCLLADQYKPTRRYLPIGEHHGDLTYGNMLATTEGIFIFDFDKGALDTPLYDFAKLEQDALFGWYRRSEHQPLYGKELDAYVLQHLAKNELYQEWRQYLLGVCLSRILIRNRGLAIKWVQERCKAYF